MTERTVRLDELLREEISQVLRRDVDDPRLGFVTITGVRVAPDLRHAMVWVSLLGSDTERRDSLRALRSAMPFVRRRLGALRLRRIPELELKVDDTAERGTRVMRLLEEIERGEDVSDDLPGADTLPSPGKRPDQAG